MSKCQSCPKTLDNVYCFWNEHDGPDGGLSSAKKLHLLNLVRKWSTCLVDTRTSKICADFTLSEKWSSRTTYWQKIWIIFCYFGLKNYVFLPQIHLINLTRRLSGFQILNNATFIFQKWLVFRIFANICHYLNFPEEY